MIFFYILIRKINTYIYSNISYKKYKEWNINVSGKNNVSEKIV